MLTPHQTETTSPGSLGHRHVRAEPETGDATWHQGGELGTLAHEALGQGGTTGSRSVPKRDPLSCQTDLMVLTEAQSSLRSLSEIARIQTTESLTGVGEELAVVRPVLVLTVSKPDKRVPAGSSL